MANAYLSFSFLSLPGFLACVSKCMYMYVRMHVCLRCFCMSVKFWSFLSSPTSYRPRQDFCPSLEVLRGAPARSINLFCHPQATSLLPLQKTPASAFGDCHRVLDGLWKDLSWRMSTAFACVALVHVSHVLTVLLMMNSSAPVLCGETLPK